LLSLINDKVDLTEMLDSNAKIKNILGTMIRKGFITDQYEITISGSELLLYCQTGKEIKLPKKQSSETQFDKWWKAFPGTNTFSYKGMNFTGSRSLRTAKLECQIKFDKIVNEGEYTAEQLVKALEYDVLQKKEDSFKTKNNKLTYLQNSLTYLNQRSYEPFIELMIMNIEVEETNQFNGTDI